MQKIETRSTENVAEEKNNFQTEKCVAQVQS